MKKKFTKRVLASVVSAATLLSCNAAVVPSSVTAAGDANYAKALALSLYFFDANECGKEVDDNCLTWRGNCHTYDDSASLDSATNLTNTEKSLIQAANGGSNTVDVSGGYHDAGDHVKFNLTMGFAASSLGLSYYMNPGAYAKAGCEDHLKEILKNTCDYFMKTTFRDDSGEVYAVCATVSDQSDHGIWTAPETQTIARPTYWLTKSKNNSVTTATMASAFAGTAYVFKESDPDYAAKCLDYAKALYKFASTYTGMEDTNSGMYSTSDTYVDDLALAQAWLYIHNEESLPTYKPTANGCYNNQYYDYYLYCWDKCWTGYATLMYYLTGDQTFANEMQFELNNQGGCPTNKYNANGWGASRYNCANQMVALGLAKGDANSTYAQGAKFQMDYILGNNSFGYSFLVGYGDKSPKQIHHRAANPNKGDATYTLYGALIGGPDSSGNYNDYYDAYQFTEPALDYNACFVLACAGLVNLYGGDASEIDSITSSASEIDETYVFGDGEVVLPTEPPTEPTDEPTEPTTEPPTEEVTEPVTTEEPTTEPPTGEIEPTISSGEIPDGSDYGNVNLDKEVNVADVVNLNMYLLNPEANVLSAESIANSDVVRDNTINTADSSLLMNYVAMMIDKDKLGSK